jgi:hypothetical protein
MWNIKFFSHKSQLFTPLGITSYCNCCKLFIIKYIGILIESLYYNISTNI